MAALQKFDCPCCGGVVVLDLDSQKTVCAYCETEYEAALIQSYLEDVTDPEPDDMTWDHSEIRTWRSRELAGMRVYNCRHCGEFLLDEHEEVSLCPICACPLEEKEKWSGNLRPDLIIPFELDQKEAKKRLKKRLNRIKLLPKIFTDEKHLEEVKGVYVPVWFFCADAEGKMICKGTQVRNWSDDGCDNTSITHYHIARAGTVNFSGVTVAGSSKIEDRMISALEPFDLRDAKEFRVNHLEDYLIYQCDVAPDACVSAVNDRIKPQTEAALWETIGKYADGTQSSFTLRLQNSSVKCVLCPVWFWTTPWKRKRYTVTLNGQTGKIAGDLPMAGKAFLGWYFSLFGIVTAVSFLIGWLLWLR